MTVVYRSFVLGMLGVCLVWGVERLLRRRRARSGAGMNALHRQITMVPSRSRAKFIIRGPLLQGGHDPSLDILHPPYPQAPVATTIAGKAARRARMTHSCGIIADRRGVGASPQVVSQDPVAENVVGCQYVSTSVRDSSVQLRRRSQTSSRPQFNSREDHSAKVTSYTK
jgi:hypothetical protein